MTTILTEVRPEAENTSPAPERIEPPADPRPKFPPGHRVSIKKHSYVKGKVVSVDGDRVTVGLGILKDHSPFMEVSVGDLQSEEPPPAAKPTGKVAEVSLEAFHAVAFACWLNDMCCSFRDVKEQLENPASPLACAIEQDERAYAIKKINKAWGHITRAYPTPRYCIDSDELFAVLEGTADARTLDCVAGKDGAL